jgi:hypothetical protein
LQFEYYFSLNEPFTLPPAWLNSHLLITGINENYGQELLRKIAKEIYYKHRDIGVLYLSPFGSRMKYEYPWDDYYYFPRNNPATPYFSGSTNNTENIRRNIKLLCAVLGFTDNFTERFSQFIYGRKLPAYLSQLFAHYKKQTEQTKEILPEDYYLLSSIIYILKESFNTHWKCTSNKIDWIESLRQGGKVFIDCTGDMAYPEWYTMLVLNTLRLKLCDGESSNKKIVVIIENAHHSLYPTYVSHQNLYLQGQFQQELFHEYAKNSIYFFLEERCPHEFCQSIYPEIPRKIFFYHHYCNLREFPLSQEEHELIDQI